VFQDPMTSLIPAMKIDRQIAPGREVACHFPLTA
jgi:ABC-type dipeptide/oligopeptide/nickel transport system ATPase component